MEVEVEVTIREEIKKEKRVIVVTVFLHYIHHQHRITTTTTSTLRSAHFVRSIIHQARAEPKHENAELHLA